MKKQLTFNFDAGLSESYTSCREYVAARVHQLGKPQKAIAMDMDYAPTTLSRKLAQSPNDSSRFTLDDLELYIQTTKDTKPIEYLVEKHVLNDTDDRVRQLEEELAFLKQGQSRKAG